MFLALFAASFLGAGERGFEGLLEGLKAESFEEREAATEGFLELLRVNPLGTEGRILKLLSGENDAEVEARLVDCLVNHALGDGKARLGFSLQYDLGAELEGEPVTGIQVQQVSPGSPAEKAGLRPRDVLLEVDGMRFSREESPQSILWRIASLIPGDEIDLLIKRGGKLLTVPIEPMKVDLEPRDVQYVTDKIRKSLEGEK